jgi:hypothetical protein
MTPKHPHIKYRRKGHKINQLRQGMVGGHRNKPIHFYWGIASALSLLRFECKRETMAENNMVLKYLQKVSLDKYLMIVEIEFF